MTGVARVSKGKKPLFIYGAGGSGREVAWLIDSSRHSPYQALAFIDDNAGQPDDWPDPRPVIGFEHALEICPEAGFVVAVGNPDTRKLLAEKLTKKNVAVRTLVHADVALSDRVVVGDGSIICAGNLLTVDIRIGCHVHVNLDCTISHDVQIGDFVTISPGVHITGNVTIEDSVFIGTGVTIINGYPDSPLVVGSRSVIAAGACVKQSLNSGYLYAGVPAVAKKRL